MSKDSTTRQVTLIRGDGIGPEIVEATVRAIEATGVALSWIEAPAGADCAEEFGEPLPQSTVATIRQTGVALKGPLMTPVGKGFRSVNVALRSELDLYANIRPAELLPGVPTHYENVDLVTVRENTEGLYSGLEAWLDREKTIAESRALVTKKGSERVIRRAFELAQTRPAKKVHLVHKANILKATGGLFLSVGREVAKEYPDIEFHDVIIDACCMKLVRDPSQFDVMVTTNLFGDILSDLTAGLVGGLGVAAGANLGDDYALFEAVHGTAPDIAGKGIANPLALILAAVLMLEYMEFKDEAAQLHRAVLEVLKDDSARTPDLGGRGSTKTFTDAIVARIR